MKVEDINKAIAKLRELREKIVALETGKYNDLDLTKEQTESLQVQVDVLKNDLNNSTALLEIGVPIELKPVEELPIDMQPINLPDVKIRR